MYSENWKNEKKKIGKEFWRRNSAGASPKDDWKKTLTGLKNEDKSMWHATNKMKVQPHSLIQ